MRGGLLSLAAALCALALLPAAASAGIFDEERSLALSIDLGESHGYDLELTTAGHHQVKMLAKGGLSEASYTVQGQVSDHRIDADFGALGKVSVRFHGRSRPTRSFFADLLDLECVGRLPRRAVGRFQGTIRFSEPNGFASTEKTSAPGEVSRTYDRACHVPRKHEHRDKRRVDSRGIEARRSGSDEIVTNALIASRQEGGRSTSLEALEFEAEGEAADIAKLFGDLVGATVREKAGRVAIARSTFQFAYLGALNVSPPGKLPERAKVEPEKPFLGNAVFLHQPGTPPSWSGELSVRLPGAGVVSLTEPGFETTLCRIKGKIPKSGCLRRAGAALRLDSGQRLPVPGLLRGQRLLTQIALKLR